VFLDIPISLCVSDQLVFLKLVPVVVVFTQYDRLVRTKKFELREEDDSMDPTILDERSKEEAQKALAICVQSLKQTMDRLNTPMPHYDNVSSITSFLFYIDWR
jgi:hypothetical protein